MEVLVGVGFLLAILVFLNTAIQDQLKKYFCLRPMAILLLPCFLAISACLIAIYYSKSVSDFIYALCPIFVYIFFPVFILCGKNRCLSKFEKVCWVEFFVILCLWLPIEYGVWSGWLKAHFHQTAHIVAYGTAVILALFLFLIFGGMMGINPTLTRECGMKYNLPRGGRDFILPFYGLLIAAAILIPLGLALKFIGPFTIPANLSFVKVAAMFTGILFGVALPEEILFRGLIQNWLMQKFGTSNKTLLVAALIFGASHLNNGPQALPNWRYMIVATIAGFIYGKVFQKSNSIFSSAGLHASVNTVRHLFFT